VRTIIVTGMVSLLFALFGTPVAIRILKRHGYGQPIRVEGPKSHETKRGTPTMGGAVIVLATLIGYLVGHWLGAWFRAPRAAQHQPVPPVGEGQLAITFGGHATVLARYHKLAIAFDPMLGRWVGGVRRAVEPGLAPGDFSDVGLILISHRHADHLHIPTLRRMPRTATIVVPAGAAAWVSSLGFARVVELQPGADLELRGIQVVAAATSHGEGDLARGLSYVIRGGGPSVYVCGDSGYFSGFADVGEREHEVVEQWVARLHREAAAAHCEDQP